MKKSDFWFWFFLTSSIILFILAVNNEHIFGYLWGSSLASVSIALIIAIKSKDKIEEPNEEKNENSGEIQ